MKTLLNILCAIMFSVASIVCTRGYPIKPPSVTAQQRVQYVSSPPDAQAPSHRMARCPYSSEMFQSSDGRQEESEPSGFEATKSEAGAMEAVILPEETTKIPHTLTYIPGVRQAVKAT